MARRASSAVKARSLPAVVRRVEKILLSTPGIENVVAIGGPAHIIRIFNSRLIGTNVGTGLRDGRFAGLAAKTRTVRLR